MQSKALRYASGQALWVKSGSRRNCSACLLVLRMQTSSRHEFNTGQT